MITNLLRTRRSAITFDVGAAGLRAVQVARGAGGASVHDVLELSAPTPAEPTAPLAPAAEPPLRATLQRGGFAGSTVAVVLSPPDVLYLPLRVPEAVFNQPPERIAAALQWEVSQQCRGNAAELELRYWRLPPGHGQHPNVMAATLPAAGAVGWCELAERQHVQLRRIEVSACALARAAREVMPSADGELIAILDLGRRQSTLTVVADATPVYVRALGGGVREWLKHVGQAFETPPAESERLLSGAAAVPSGTSADAGGGLLVADEIGAAVADLLRPSIVTLSGEIVQCLAYVLRSYPEYHVARVWLAGGGAQVACLGEALAALLDLPVDVLQMQPATHARATGFGPRAAMAYGAALLDLEDAT